MFRAAFLAVIFTAACAASAPVPAAEPLRLVMIDAEGGAAALFVTPEGRSLLVDTGWPSGMGGAAGPAGAPPTQSTADRIAAAAAELGVRKIDYVLVTHYHLDHVGGVHDLIARMPVGVFFDHGPNREAPTPEQAGSPNTSAALYARYEAALEGRRRRSVGVNDQLRIGSLTLRFVAADREVISRPLRGAAGEATPGCDTTPDLERIGGEENPRSLGFVAEFGDARILDLGDLTWNVEKRLVCPVNRVGPIDLLLVSHHGSELSNSPPLIAATAPRVALVANGARKGGDASVLETLRTDRSAPSVWQMHFATRAPEANRPDDYVANLDAQPDAGYMLRTEIFRDGAMTVTNMRNGFTERYLARSASAPRDGRQ